MHGVKNWCYMWKDKNCRATVGSWVGMLEVTLKLFRFGCRSVDRLIPCLVFLTIACAGSAPDDTDGSINMIGADVTQPTPYTEMVPKPFLSDPSLKIGGNVGNQAPECEGINAWINGGHIPWKTFEAKLS